MEHTIITLDPPQSFKEFLRSIHTGLLKSPLDMVELGVHLDFDLWLKGMSQKELFSWVEAYREDGLIRAVETAQEILLGLT